MIKNYTPNQSFKDYHKVLLKLQTWDFKAEYVVNISNGLRGLDVVNFALERLDLQFYKEFGEGYELEFKNSKGKALLLSDDDGEGEDWLKQFLVGYEILDFTSEMEGV